MSLYTTKPLRKLVKRHFSPARVRGSDVELVIGAVNLHTGQRREWNKQDVGPESILASSAFPVAFEPVKIDGQLYTDDGVRETTPLEAAIKGGCDRIYVIQTGRAGVVSGHLPGKPHLWDIAARNLAAMMAEIELWDLKVAGLYNIIIHHQGFAQMAETAEVCGDKRRVDIRIIEPSEPLGDPLDFGNAKSLTNMERGREAAAQMVGAWE